MANKIVIPKDQIIDLIEDAVFQESDTSYRHGSYETYVVPYQGKHYTFTLTCSPNEGLDLHYDVDAVEVVPKEITKIEWVIAK